jgi:hypothetical protein
VIIRVVGDSQYEAGKDIMADLDELDTQAVTALERGDEAELDRCLDEMARLVREHGRRLDDDTLTASDVIIPPSDLTLEETRRLFSDTGLIPDPATPNRQS